MTALLLLTAGLTTTASPASAASGPTTIEVLSNRADLVSGGDALVAVNLPAGTDPSAVRVDIGGRDVTPAFVVRSNGRFEGLVGGLANGANLLTARLPDGSGAHITITNHPMSGPVFSGPQIQPWTCAAGAQDTQCDRPPSYAFYYEPKTGGPLQSYDPSTTPMSAVAMTTTDQGHTVPFIVRQETGAIARDEYRIAVLSQPGQPYEPGVAQAGYNSKLVLFHGASCDTAYAAAAAPDVLNVTALGKGFATASSALDNAGHNCNIVTEAESLVMTKERVAEQYGPIRYTIGSGCSGGSLVQQQVANAYPGIYQGITPQCSFTDAWSSSQQYEDYTLLRHYFEDPTRLASTNPPQPAEEEAAYGHPNPANADTFTTVIPNSGDPSRSCPGLSQSQVYNAQTNPKGVRCTLQDYMVNVFGQSPDGKARRPFDNVGIQYGLNGLTAGTVTPAEFVDLNTAIGGYDIDLKPQADRSVADSLALQRVYRSGAVDGASHLDQVPIIDMRGPDNGSFHDVYRTYSMRQRLIREHGTAANQILWRGQLDVIGDDTFVDASIIAMDSWLAAIEQDHRAVPLSQKVIEDKPTAVTDRCTDGHGTDAPTATCDATVLAYGSPRTAAGGPVADDTLKCQLKPLDRADYPGTLTDAQLAQLRQVFPTGVCDYTKPAVSKQDAVTWMTYANVVGGEPLGAAPQSVPFDAGSDITPVVPEAPAAVVLPLVALVIGAGAYGLRRRRGRLVG